MAKRATKQGDSKMAVAYIRASRGESQQKLSPESQRTAIEQWAARTGVTIVAWHVERVCSTTAVEGREVLVSALDDLRGLGAGILVCAKRDRIARDLVLATVIEREVVARGARLVSCAGEGTDSTGSCAQLQRGLSDLFAAHELNVIRERTRDALQAKRTRGERVGSLAYGYSMAADGVHLTPNAAEQSTIATARGLRASGLSLRAIVDALTAQGMLSRAGKPFVPCAVANMLASETPVALAA